MQLDARLCLFRALAKAFLPGQSALYASGNKARDVAAPFTAETRKAVRPRELLSRKSFHSTLQLSRGAGDPRRIGPMP